MDSGTIDGAVIGGADPAAGSFTTLSAADSITLDGVTITGWGGVVSPWTDAGLTTTLNAADTDFILTHATGELFCTILDTDNITGTTNDQTIDLSADTKVIFGDAGDTFTIEFDGTDTILQSSDRAIVFYSDQADGEVHFKTATDVNDYLIIDTDTNIVQIKTAAGGGDGDLSITADGGEIDFDDENLSTSGTLGAGATTVTSLIIGDDTLANAADNTFTMTSNDEHMILKVISGAGGKDASLFLVADADANPADDWVLKSIAADNDFHIINGTTLRLTMSAAGNILTTGSIQIPDDVNHIFGTDSDWAIQYDEAIDNQLLFVTTNTAAIATTDPMFEILVGTVPTADQQVFGIAKGTQAANTPLLTLDEDGDLTIAGTFAQTGTSQFIQDDTIDGVVDAAQFIHSSNDGDSTNNDGVAIAFHLMNDADVTEEFGSIDVVATDVSDGAEDADFVFSQYTAGTMAETLRIVAASSDTVSDYMQFTANTTETNLPTNVLVLKTATGTAADNYGMSISFQPEDATGSAEVASLDIIQTTAARATNDTDFVFSQMVAGAVTETLRLDADSGMTYASAVTTLPLLWLENTTDDATCPIIRLENDRAAEADGDDLGRLSFYGSDDGDAASEFVYILAEAADITATDEAGKLTIGVEMDDVATSMLVIAGNVGSATGDIDFNAGEVDVDFRINTLDQADIFMTDGASNDVMITRDLAAASTSAALLQILNTNVGDSQSALTVIQDATTATAALPAVSIQTTGDTDQSTLLINDDSSTGGTGKASLLVDSEATDTAALYITSAVDASGTSPIYDDYAVAIASEGKGGVLKLYRNVDAVTEHLFHVEEVHIDSIAPLATFSTAADASADDTAVTIATSSAAFDQRALFINHDCTAGATKVPAVEIDSEQTTAASLIVRGAQTIAGTDIREDEAVLAVVAEGVGGIAYFHRNIATTTKAGVTIEEQSATGTKEALYVTTAQNATADTAMVHFETTDGAHDQAALKVTQANAASNAIEIVSGALAIDGDSITCDGVLVINATSAVDFSDEDIDNVGDIEVDSITSAAATVVKINDGLQGLVDEITATSEGVAASLTTVITEITTNSDSDLDIVNLANGVSGQIKIFVIVVEAAGGDSVKIVPATFLAGTQITFDGTVGDGCIMIYADSEGWIVVGNNGGTIG